PEAARLVGALGDPHLLERRPVVGRTPRAQERPAVGRLELAVHLQPAVVRSARVGPGGLGAVDAEPLRLVRRGQRLELRAHGALSPEIHDPLPVGEAANGLGAGGVGGARALHHLLPPPRLGAMAVDLSEQAGELRTGRPVVALGLFLARVRRWDERDRKQCKRSSKACGFHPWLLLLLLQATATSGLPRGARKRIRRGRSAVWLSSEVRQGSSAAR